MASIRVQILEVLPAHDPPGRARHSVRAVCPTPEARRARSDAPYLADPVQGRNARKKFGEVSLWQLRSAPGQGTRPTRANRQSMAQLETIGCSILDVGCWMFSFGSGVQCANFSGNSLPSP